MKKHLKILIFIFLITLSFRLYFAFQTPHYSSDSSYYHLRQVQHISENFRPLFFDTLSAGGRIIINPHLYHYVLTIFYQVFPELITFKVIPAILLSSLVFIVFYIAKTITKHNASSLLSAFISGFLPIFIFETLNKISIFSLILPLIFLMIFFLLNIKKYLSYFIFFSIVLSLLHPFGFVLSITFILYLLLLNLESIGTKKIRKEAIFFFIFISLLINLILYKKAFLSLGLTAVWRNMPPEILLELFKNMTPLNIITSIGFISLIFGTAGFLLGVFQKTRKAIYLLSSLILAIFLLLFFRMISFSIGVMVLGISLTIMSSLSFKKIRDYLSITKFNQLKPYLLIAFIFLIIFTVCIPAYTNAQNVIEKTISKEEIQALEWIKENTRNDITVLAGINEGNYINTIAKRKNVIDNNFLIEAKRYNDVKTIYTSNSLVKASQTLNKYNVDYFYLSNRAQKFYKTNKIDYVKDETCFKEVYKNEKSQVFKFIC